MFDSWNNPDSLKEIVHTIVQEAEKRGATSSEVDIALNKGFSVAGHMREVESVEYNQDKIADITVYVGHRTGSASLSDLRPEAIKEAVKAACNLARYSDEDVYSGLAEKEFLAFHYPEINLSYPWDITVEQAINLALECEEIALAQDPRISKSENVAVATGEVLHVYGNSYGFIGTYQATRHELSCILVAEKEKDMQRDYYYTVACDPALLESPKDVALKAANATVSRLGAKGISTRKTPVIFSAEMARGLIGHFVSAISGGNLYRKSSFLLDCIDQSIFPEFISIKEFPFLPRSLGSAPFDSDGVSTRENTFIEKGILKSYALGVYSARKLGMQTTGNAGGVHNLFITTGQKDLPALMKTMGTGLYVTELMGQGVNLVTGDYSRGAAGYWVENGEIQYPVHEVTIAGKLLDIYRNLVEVGNDVDHRGNIRSGSILIDSMMVAGE